MIQMRAPTPLHRMSLLIVRPGLSLEQTATDPHTIASLAEARRQGFGTGHAFEWDKGSGWWFKTPHNPRGSGAFTRQGARFAAYVGSTHWRGLSGEAMLEKLLATYAEPRQMPLDEFSGSFAMLWGGESGVWLFNDPLGIHKIYETADRRLASTSFMVCRATLKSPVIDRLRAQEYVLLGANHGLGTPIRGVRITEPTEGRELRTSSTATLYPATRWRVDCPFRHPSEAIASLASNIEGVFGEMVGAFGANIGMALSGGFDSRLLLAALDRVGVTPTLYVYGAPMDEDVRIASTIAAGLGVDIECIDKPALNRTQPALTLDALRSSIAFFDGLPPDGAFDLGADQRTRLKQVEGGRLNLNGGGGEILRNFFYLRDRAFTPADVAAAFYSNWPPQAIHSSEERRAFFSATEAGIANCLGRDAAQSAVDPLPRSDTELVYSLFRLRYWMGRNNSLAGRYGAFLTPLVNPRLASIAAGIPLAWKNFGRMEAAIIQALSPRVASGPSAYGFEFDRGPGWTHRLKVSTTLFRPVALRRQSARIRRALGLARSVAVPQEWQHVAAELPAQDWIDAEALSGEDQLNRLLTLQAVASDELSGVRVDTGGK